MVWNSLGQNTGGEPFSSPGDLPNTGIKPRPPALQADSLPAEPQGKPITIYQLQMKSLSRVQLFVGLQPAWASLVAQIVKNLPAVEKTQVQSLCWEDPLEKGMANHSSILAWRIPMDRRNLVGCNPWGHKESDTTEHLSTHT